MTSGITSAQASCYLQPPLQLPDSQKKKKRKEQRIQTFETKWVRKLLRISYLEHKTNDWVRSKINYLEGPQEPLLATVKRRKLAWFRHLTRHDILSKTILQGTLEDGRCRGLQRKCRMDNRQKVDISARAKTAHKGLRRKDWKRIAADPGSEKQIIIIDFHSAKNARKQTTLFTYL